MGGTEGRLVAGSGDNKLDALRLPAAGHSGSPFWALEVARWLETRVPKRSRVWKCGNVEMGPLDCQSPFDRLPVNAHSRLTSGRPQAAKWVAADSLHFLREPLASPVAQLPRATSREPTTRPQRLPLGRRLRSLFYLPPNEWRLAPAALAPVCVWGRLGPACSLAHCLSLNSASLWSQVLRAKGSPRRRRRRRRQPSRLESVPTGAISP